MNNWDKVDKKAKRQSLNEFYIKHYGIIAIYLIGCMLLIWLMT